MSSRTKKRERKPKMAKILEVYTMKGPRGTPNTAGAEQRANIASDRWMSNRQAKNIVYFFLPFSIKIKRPVWGASVKGRNLRASLRKGLLWGSRGALSPAAKSLIPV